MFKTSLTAAAFALIAGLSHAAPGPQDLTLDTGGLGPGHRPKPPSSTNSPTTASGVTVYDYWGNWMTVWQCY